MGLFDDYKHLLFKKEVPEKGLLVPLLCWSSANPDNINLCQAINRKF